ncbi:MAG TPA: hypothetical protein VMJ64_03790 [Anaerolineales bacterium]|nr:hypothetical protein [Anaerolineales bacterium]
MDSMNGRVSASLCILMMAWQLAACSVDITQGPQLDSTNLLPTWAGLHISGKLVYTAGERHGTNVLVAVRMLNLSTGDITTLFRTPAQGWVDSAAVSPDGKQIAISYVPPNGQQTIYMLPADGSQPPQPLVAPDQPGDRNSQAVWSPDGRYIYFVHMSQQNSGHPEIQRIAFPGGIVEIVVSNAAWPRLSPDSRELVYVHVDPETAVNRLFVTSADGTGQRQVTLSGGMIPNVIDAPMFSPDAQSILFSAPHSDESSAWKWLGSMLPIALIHAPHGSIPSDWWSVPVGGGVKQQLTHIPWLSLFGSYAPDNQHIATYTASGIFVMNPDGTGVTVVVSDTGGIPGTVNWIP